MTVEEAVLQRLLDTAEVTAVVSSRVWLYRMPPNPTMPAVLVQLIADTRMNHLRGPNGTSPARIQVDAYVADSASTAPGLIDLSDAIDLALSGEAFTVGSPSRTVQFCNRLDRRVLYEFDELKQLRMMQDYRVWSRMD
jgi:hypothetical protein